MWWVEALGDGFRYPASPLPICLFRVVIAVAALYKFGYEHHRGAWRWFAPDSYVYYRYRREHPRFPVGPAGYRVLYLAKFAAAGALLVGVLPRLAALVLAGWFLFELRYDRKFHTAYLGLCSLFLVASPALGQALTYQTVLDAVAGDPAAVLRAEASRVADDAFGQLLLVLLTVQMYLSSAYRKLRSPQFMSGAALHAFTASLHAERHAQRFRDTWYPPLVARHFIDVPEPVARRRWRPAAVATVVLETVLPVALLVPAAFPVAAATGLLMHLAFTALLPIRLVPFSLATVGSYLLFIDPATAADWPSFG
ncbi:MAG TPA: hypothetical protein VIL37_09585 [Natronosporangium sp.]